MNSIDMNTLVTLLSLGLIFVLFITKAYTKSIATTIYVVSLAISMQLYVSNHCSEAIVVIVVGATISLIRAVVTHDKDRLWKRGGL